MKPTVNQIECHPYLNQHRLLSFCNANNIRITAYSPLGCKDRLWKSPDDDQPLLDQPLLLRIAKHYEKSIAQVLLRWQVCSQTITKLKGTEIVHRYVLYIFGYIGSR